MEREIIMNGRDSCSSVVYLHQVGSEACEPGHSFGPAIRDHYLIHCILEGEGTFYVGKRQYRLKKGEGFLIVPGVVTYYQADGQKPWTYCWVGFNGTDANNICSQCGISMENPTFQFSDTEKMEECIRSLCSNYGANRNGFLTLAQLYEFFSMLQGGEMAVKKGAGLIDLAVDYISKNYSYSITVSQIANHLGISRSHLFRIFKENMGQSVQEYLLSFRLERAEVLMEQTDMSIKEIMYSCGFNDLPNFSRQFRKAFGKPPGTYRKLKWGK
jgi:AraC-like DNA-binding protein